MPYFPAICGGLVRYAGDGLLYLLLGVLEVHELARQVLLVGGEVLARQAGARAKRTGESWK